MFSASQRAMLVASWRIIVLVHVLVQCVHKSLDRGFSTTVRDPRGQRDKSIAAAQLVSQACCQMDVNDTCSPEFMGTCLCVNLCIHIFIHTPIYTFK